MKFVYNLYKSFDFYGTTNFLNINGKDKIQTTIGSFLGLLMTSLVLIATWLIGNDIIYKEKPQLNIQEDFLSSRINTQIDLNTFSFSIALQRAEDMKVFHNDKYFKYEIKRIELNNSSGEIISEKDFLIEKCQKRHFPNFDELDFIKRGLFNYFCPKDLNTTIYGYYDEPSMAFLLLRLKICVNKTSELTCSSIEEIEKEIKSYSYSWNIYMQNTFADTTDYLNPIKYLIFNLGTYIQTKKSGIQEVYVRNLVTKTDSGIIFENFMDDNSLNFDSDRIFPFTDFKSNAYHDFYIHPSVRKNTYIRRYIKAQNIFANLGGIIKLLMFISRLLNHIFSVHMINYLYLINSFSKLDECSEEIKYNESQKNLKIIKINKRNDFKLEEDNLKIKNQKFKKTDLNFSNIEIIKKQYCFINCQSKQFKDKNLLFEKGVKFIKDRLNIINLISKQHELENLKAVLLNEEQISMFQNICKYHSNIFENMHFNRIYDLIHDDKKNMQITKEYLIKLNRFELNSKLISKDYDHLIFRRMEKFFSD